MPAADQCVSAGCQGARAPSLDSCFVHADDVGVELAVASLLAGSSRLDLRFTPLSQAAVDRVFRIVGARLSGPLDLAEVDLGGAKPVEDIVMPPITLKRFKADDLVSSHALSLALTVESVVTMYNAQCGDMVLTLRGDAKANCSGLGVRDTFELRAQSFAADFVASPLVANDIVLRFGDSPKASVFVSPNATHLSVLGGSVGSVRIEHGVVDQDIDIGGVEAREGISLSGTRAKGISLAGCSTRGLLLRGTTADACDLDRCPDLGHVTVDDLDCAGDLVARGVTVTSIAGRIKRCAILDIAGCEVRGDCDFDGSVVGNLVLDDVRIGADLSMSGSDVRGHASLRRAQIEGSFRAVASTFATSCSLDQAQIRGDVTLRRVSVAEVLGLEYARVGGDTEAIDVRVDQSARLNGLRLAGPAYIEVDAPTIDCSALVGEGVFRASVKADFLRMTDGVFGERVELRTEGRTAGVACAVVLRSVEPKGRMLVDGCERTSLIDLRGARCDAVRLQRVALDRCLFSSATGLEELRLTGESFGRRTPKLGRGRVVLPEDPAFDPSRVQDQFGTVGAEASLVLDDREPAAWSTIAERYRNLRKGLEDSKDSAGASEFFFAEMQARRKAATSRPFERYTLGAYRWFGGYGVRPLAPSLALLALLVVTTLLALVSGAVSATPARSQVIHIAPSRCALSFGGAQGLLPIRCPRTTGSVRSAEATTERNAVKVGVTIAASTLGFTRALDSRLSTWGDILVIVSRLLGLALVAFLVLGLRSVVQR